MSKNKVINLIQLLNINLVIPNYQRPYEWAKSNVYVLLDDIYSSYVSDNSINLGAIILYKNESNTYDIVDGQQRLVTLSLLLKRLDKNGDYKLLNQPLLCISNTEKRIINNYYAICDFIKKLEIYEGLNTRKFLKYLRSKVSFYVLKAKDSNESFQLFDGRNSKFKDLTPVDLLKAYHLGALPKNYSNKEKQKILIDWNTNINTTFSIDNSCNKIDYLYNNILFNIYNWSLNKDYRPLRKDDIYLYKGYKISKNEDYAYVDFYKNSNLYQINKPFKAGEDFFKMTKQFIKNLDDIIDNKNLKEKLGYYDDYYDNNLRFINYLYYGALFAFYDRFGKNVKSFYKGAVEDFIFKYSILLRMKKMNLGLTQLNYYILNTKDNFFFKCNNALKVDELLKLELEDIGNPPSERDILGRMRIELWKKLTQLNVSEDDM